MKAYKTPFGSWRAQVYDYTDGEGKVHRRSFTAPTKAECLALAEAFAEERKKRTRPVVDLTVSQAIDRYIELSPMLSPTTIDGYRKVQRTAFASLMPLHVSALTDEVVQEAINAECKRPARSGGRISAKTVRNSWGVIAASLSSVCKLTFNVRLPHEHAKNKELPPVETVIAVIQTLQPSASLACLLALWLSLSMSEIRGLRASDLHGDVLFIDRVLVDVGTTPTLKENAKVETRIRKHRLSPYLLQKIKETPAYMEYTSAHIDSYLVPLSHESIYKPFKVAMTSAGYPNMTFHDLRHMNASVMLMLGIPNKYAMERGGWKTPHVLESVYQHTFSAERLAVDAKVDEYFEALISF